MILDHLGDAYLAAGRIADARQAWQRALNAMEQQNEDPTKIEAVRAKLQANPEPPAPGH